MTAALGKTEVAPTLFSSPLFQVGVPLMLTFGICIHQISAAETDTSTAAPVSHNEVDDALPNIHTQAKTSGCIRITTQEPDFQYLTQISLLLKSEMDSLSVFRTAIEENQGLSLSSDRMALAQAMSHCRDHGKQIAEITMDNYETVQALFQTVTTVSARKAHVIMTGFPEQAEMFYLSRTPVPTKIVATSTKLKAALTGLTVQTLMDNCFTFDVEELEFNKSPNCPNNKAYALCAIADDDIRRYYTALGYTKLHSEITKAATQAALINIKSFNWTLNLGENCPDSSPTQDLGSVLGVNYSFSATTLSTMAPLLGKIWQQIDAISNIHARSREYIFGNAGNPSNAKCVCPRPDWLANLRILISILKKGMPEKPAPGKIPTTSFVNPISENRPTEDLLRAIVADATKSFTDFPDQSSTITYPDIVLFIIAVSAVFLATVGIGCQLLRKPTANKRVRFTKPEYRSYQGSAVSIESGPEQELARRIATRGNRFSRRQLH